VARALFNLNAHCGTVVSCSDEKVVHFMGRRPIRPLRIKPLTAVVAKYHSTGKQNRKRLLLLLLPLDPSKETCSIVLSKRSTRATEFLQLALSPFSSQKRGKASQLGRSDTVNTPISIKEEADMRQFLK
jgi:hypothetical protein